VEESLPPEFMSPSREDQIRALGFDPSQLTPMEQEDLLEIYSLCPDEAMSAS
jgi:hypothetical protein